jgi:hypothetical protein
MTWGNPISVLTQTPIIRNFSEDPFAIASTGYDFMNVIEDKVWNLYQQNLEKEARIEEVEEKLQQEKIDEGSLESFK